MAYPSAEDLMGIGVAPELASILGGLSSPPAVSDLAMLGMPIEQAAALNLYNIPENLLLYSEDFTNGAWVPTNMTVTGDQIANPFDGKVTADLHLETTTNAYHYQRQTINVTSGVIYTWSAYVKAYGGLTTVEMHAEDQFAAGQYRVNLTTGVGTAASAITGNVTPLANGWYRISVTQTATGTGAARFFVLAEQTSGVQSYAGAVTNGFYLFGGQVRKSFTVGDYQATTTAAVTATAKKEYLIGLGMKPELADVLGS